jgi:hypothetical protein
MKAIRMVQFEEDDQPDLRRVTEWCSEAVSFFTDRDVNNPKTVPAGTPMVIVTRLRIKGDEMKPIYRLSAGNPLTLDHLGEAMREIVAAQKRVRATKPNQCFPAELKDRYDDNLSAAQTTVASWIDQANEG